tara:strand:+ start:154 stop:324 length:171 start_codon:yes stop_codon:yes gene_type:complete
MSNHLYLLVSIPSKEEQEKLYEKRNLKTEKLRSRLAIIDLEQQNENILDQKGCASL